MIDKPIAQRVARNSALYFSSLALPALAAVFLVPVTVRALGPARFGLLALAWAVAEGSGMFDFGLGRATVRFVADASVRGTDRLRQVILSALVSQLAMGLIAGVILFTLAPFLATSVFSIPPAAQPEATAMFRVLAFHMPILLATASLRAVLEGAQRFDLSTALRMPSSLASVVIPAIAASAGASLAAIMWLLFIVRFVLALINAATVKRALLSGPWALPSGIQTLREMLRYSGWVAVSTAMGPILASFDRFVVGSVAGIAALGYYTGAAEAATRFLLIPATAFSALLPALATDVSEARDRVLSVTRAARRQLAALLLPLCIALFVFAPAILSLWLGPPFAEAAGTALRILSVGVFLTGLAHLSLALLYASGRSDLPAKINIVQLALHVPITLVLVGLWGITGAAIAWSLRCAEDLLLYERARRRAIGPYATDADESQRARRFVFSAGALATAIAFANWVAGLSWMASLAVVAIGFALYTWSIWIGVFTERERSAWAGMILPAHSAIPAHRN
jgi:O-antigen/teichoic acid export membrane protein